MYLLLVLVSRLLTLAAILELSRVPVIWFRRRCLGWPTSETNDYDATLTNRSHWAFKVGFFITALALLALALYLDDFTLHSIPMIVISFFYALFGYYNGAEFTGHMNWPGWRTWAWPFRRRRTLVYECYPSLSTPRRPDLNATWRRVVTQYEPSRLFSQNLAVYTREQPSASNPAIPVIWYASDSTSWAWTIAFVDKSPPLPNAARILYVTDSRWLFVIPIVRELCLISGIINGRDFRCIYTLLKQGHSMFMTRRYLERNNQINQMTTWVGPTPQGYRFVPLVSLHSDGSRRRRSARGPPLFAVGLPQSLPNPPLNLLVSLTQFEELMTKSNLW
jgi:hypothetical protein